MCGHLKRNLLPFPLPKNDESITLSMFMLSFKNARYRRVVDLHRSAGTRSSRSGLLHLFELCTSTEASCSAHQAAHGLSILKLG